MNITISAEERKSFEDFTTRRLAEAGGGRTFAEDARIVREMLRAVREEGLTPTADGGVSFVRRGGLDWTAPGAVEAARSALAGQSDAGPESRATSAREMLVGLGVLLAVILGGLWYFGAFSSAAAADRMPLSPTVTANLSAATATPIPTLEADLLDVSGGAKTALVSPRTLEIRGVSFVVQPVRIDSGAWPLPDDPRAVSWVAGTVVNYVFGLEATAGNKTLLAGLRPGDELLLRMSTGPAYRFAVADTVRVPPQASEIFRQTRPGLTLTLLGDAGQADRVVIRAVYLPASELGLAAEPLPDPTPAPSLAVTAARLRPDGALALSVAVVAPTQALTLTAADVTLAGAILNPDNAFPWRVDAGRAATFTLSLRPTAPSARLSILNAAAELSGWPDFQ